MNQMIGADVAELRQLAAQFSAAANQLRASAARVDGGIRVSAWVGPVAVRFRLAWDSEHSRAVRDVAQALEDAGRRLTQEASDQDAASGSLSPTASHRTSSAPGAGSSGSSLWDFSHGPRTGAGWLTALTSPGVDINAAVLGEELKKHKWLKGAKTTLGPLGWILSGLDLVEGVSTQDPGPFINGLGGVALGGLAVVGGGAAVVPVAIGSTVVFVGTSLMPVDQEGFDGSFDYMMREQFGSDYDPENVTPEQTAWQTEHLSGPGGYFNAIRAGAGYKAGQIMSSLEGSATEFGEFTAKEWPW